MATQYQNVTVDCSCILNVFDSWVLYINFDVRLLEAYYIVMKCFWSIANKMFITFPNNMVDPKMILCSIGLSMLLLT